jgi:hypothetical protein
MSAIPPFLETDEQRRERISKAIEYAGRYARSFDRELLNHWYKSIVEHTLPASASYQELVADNAVRAFVMGIIRQYQLAITGSLETPWQPIPPMQEPKQRQTQRKQQQPNKPQQRRRSKRTASSNRNRGSTLTE